MNPSLRTNWLIAMIVTGWLVYLLAPVLTPFVASALLAYVGDPLADRLQKLKLPRSLAVAAVFILTFLVLALLVLLVGPLISAQVGALLDACSILRRARMSASGRSLQSTVTWLAPGALPCLVAWHSRAALLWPRC
jgi:predicted PurR-regulated permease PerM